MPPKDSERNNEKSKLEELPKNRAERRHGLGYTGAQWKNNRKNKNKRYN